MATVVSEDMFADDEIIPPTPVEKPKARDSKKPAPAPKPIVVSEDMFADDEIIAPQEEAAPVAPTAPEEPKSWFDMISPYGAETAAKENPEWWQTGIAAFKDLGSAPGRAMVGGLYGTTDVFAEALQNPINAIKNMPETYKGGFKEGFDAGASNENPNGFWQKMGGIAEDIVEDPYGGAAMLAAPLVAPIAAAQPAISYLSKLPYAIGKIGMGAVGGAGAGAATQLSENLYDGLDADRDIVKAATIGGVLGGGLTGATTGLDKLRKSGLGAYVQDILANTKASIANKSKQEVENIVEEAAKDKFLGFGIKDAIAEKFSDKAKKSKEELAAIFRDLDEKYFEVVEPNVSVGDFESGVFNPKTKQFESRSPNDRIQEMMRRSVAPLEEARTAELMMDDRLYNSAIPSKVIEEEIAPRLYRTNNATNQIEDLTHYPPNSRRGEGIPGSGFVRPSEVNEIRNSLYEYANDYVGPHKKEIQQYVDELNSRMAKKLDEIYMASRPIDPKQLAEWRQVTDDWAHSPDLMIKSDEELLKMTPEQIYRQLANDAPDATVRRQTLEALERGDAGLGALPMARTAMDEAASSKALVEGTSKSKYFKDNKKLADTKVRDIGSLQLLTDAVNQATKPGRFTGPGAKIAVGGAGKTRSLPIPLATLMASQLTEQDYKAVERILLKPEKDRTEKEISFLKAKGQL